VGEVEGVEVLVIGQKKTPGVAPPRLEGVGVDDQVVANAATGQRAIVRIGRITATVLHQPGVQTRRSQPGGPVPNAADVITVVGMQ